VPVAWETYLDRLGPQGLRVVLSGLVSPAQLSETVGQAVNGISSNELALFVVDRVAEQPEVGKRLLELLDERAKDVDAPSDEPSAREVVAQILRDPSAEAAGLIHRMARTSRSVLPSPELRTAADLVASALFREEMGTRPKGVAKVASDRSGVKELEQERRELEARMRKLEGQLARAVERSASLESRLSRRTEELAAFRRTEREQRDERQRLEREIARLKKRIDDQNERRARERTGEVTTALRRLTTEQRRTASALETLEKGESERRDTLRQNTRVIGSLSELVEKLVTIREAESRTASAAQEEIRRELIELRRELAEGTVSEPAGATNKRQGGRGASSEETPRVALFVDVQNMFYAARERHARLDFEALLETITGDRRLVRAVAYVVETKEIDQSAFIHLLQMKAYEVKRKPLKVRPDRSAKGDWDLEMALDALTTAENAEVVVLVTGDGDFVPLVRELKLRGRRVEVYGFPRSTAPDLREAADRFYPVTRRLLRAQKARRGSATRSSRS
jgi:uncharacterized LabA/DUF88 family protein